MKWELWFDGLCEPVNPGGVSTGAYVIRAEGKLVEARGMFCKEGSGSTNNVAEYMALLAGLRAVTLMVAETDTLSIYGDSQLVCYQVDDSWNCNKDHLRSMRDEARKLLAPFKWDVTWIPREKNHEADALSQQAYVEHTGRPYPIRRSIKFPVSS